MPTLAFGLEVKEFGEPGQFHGFAAVYGNRDEVGDVLEVGALQKTLNSSKTRPLLWEHRDPVGIVELTDTPAGLVAHGRLTLAVRQAAETYALMRDGVVKGLSIGFETIRSDYVGAVRHLKEIKLWEVSLVTLPANQLAVVTSVKAADQARVRAALREFRRDVLAALGGNENGNR